MAPVRLALPLLAALALLAPGAVAAAAQGELESGSLRLSQDARLESAGLDILTRGAAAPALTLDVTDVAIQKIGTQRVEVGGPASTGVNARDIDERAAHPAARLTLAAGQGDHVVALRALGPATATLGAADVRGVAGALLATASLGGPACHEEYADYCLDVFGAYELAAPHAHAVLAGEITLLLYGPTLVVQDDAGATTEYTSGYVSTQDAAVGRTTEESWVVVRAKGATGVLAAPDALLYAAAPTLHATQADFQDAEGALRVGAKDYRARGDDVAATGALTLVPTAVPPGTEHGIDGRPVYAESFRTRVTGEVHTINLGATPVYLDTTLERVGAAALLAALLGAIAYAWNHLLFGAAALYTRLNKPDILDNDVRNHIYDIIRQNPGISAREVHRRSSQSWGTVVYHLRQLERHHLVVSRALGRTRNYYENHGKYRGMEAQLACLQSDRARTLARAIAAQPGITQEALAEASGFPQPTTSYYVRKLKQAGLVEEQREGRYVKYVPHADLPRYIQMSESSVQSGANAASGVQA